MARVMVESDTESVSLVAPDLLSVRRAGTLLHITSLPGLPDNGDLGPEAYHFCDFLVSAGLSVWQVLPLHPTHEDRSPYNALSVHAGDPALISPALLVDAGWLDQSDVDDMIAGRCDRQAVLQRAGDAFHARADVQARQHYEAFINANRGWLDNYALYMALRQANGRLPWHMWPLEERDRQPKVLSNARQRLAAEIRQYVFEQFMFEQQWQALKGYANTRGVKLFGDMPIFVAHDSAEVWAHRDCFELDAQGRMEVVTGVPPDYFSATGQRWGNPHYRWEVLRKQDYDWWVARMETALAHFDLVRIDHFRGFESCWEIPADTEDAQQGHWVSVPGAELFATLTRRLGTLPVVAEDLGLITDEVEALRTDCGFPGMKVMQFGFSGEPENPHLLHMHTRDSVVYTGTHDNDTTVGWFENLEPAVRTRVLSYLGHPVDPMPWPLIRWALASPACLAILPFQDLLMLGSDSRMNLPGTAEGNWRWRFSRDQIPPTRAADVRSLVQLYGRVADQS